MRDENDDNNEEEEQEEEQEINLNALRYYFHLLSQYQEQERDNDKDLIEVDKNQMMDEFHNTSFAQEMMKETKCYPNKPNKTIFSMLQKRESNINCHFSMNEKKHITSRLIPSEKSKKTLAVHANQVFCGQFSKDGRIFMSACQDKMLRLYDSENWSCLKKIRARDVGWAVLDTDYSPDQRWVIYTSWSNYVHMCNTTGENETHEDLDMRPESNGRFCLFSVKFSPNSQEIMGGSCDRRVYIYDLIKKERIMRIEGHSDDINTVAYADETGNIFYSGSDDQLIKVWDRRSLKQGMRSSNVGTLVGHLEGITHIHSKGDGRYLISNGKDQCIKLWDIRKMTDNNVQPKRVSNWDYRGGFRGNRGNTFNGRMRDSSDISLMTYRGHSVLQTLIRSYFSPQETTGQKYIYAGSHDGYVYIFDVLTGEIVKKLGGHQATIRDLSWHPFKPQIVSTSFDGTVRVWETENSNSNIPCYNERRHFNFLGRDDDDDDDNDNDNDNDNDSDE